MLTDLYVGVSCFIGLAVICLFLPINHWAGKVVVVAQDSLMKARDERVSLMNEILGAIRMLKVSVRFCGLYRHFMLLTAVHGMGTEFREEGSENQGEGTSLSTEKLHHRGTCTSNSTCVKVSYK